MEFLRTDNEHIGSFRRLQVDNTHGVSNCYELVVRETTAATEVQVLALHSSCDLISAPFSSILSGGSVHNCHLECLKENITSGSVVQNDAF